MRIAVIGSGISGLSAAYHLSKKYHVDLFEKDDHFGGHSYTYDIKEISNVAGYVVSYTCKGNLMPDEEKDIISSEISSMDAPCYDGKEEISYVAKNAVNILSGRRVVGQPETLH